MEIRYFYACDFDLTKPSGKERATRQKLAALGSIVQLTYVAMPRIKALSFFYVDFFCCYKLVTKKYDVYISRGNFGLFSVLVARARGITTYREVHADQLGETKLLNKPRWSRALLYLYALYSRVVDKLAHGRIFNHPDLMGWFHRQFGEDSSDFYCFNGFEERIESHNRVDILKKYGLNEGKKYLVFVGSASKWHGIELLLRLQVELRALDESYLIICGGGDIAAHSVRESGVVNISPLDDLGCDELISISYACLLPVESNRVSPGSPLKLYDYIAHRKFVFTQNLVRGYSDEVQKYGFGMPIDLKDSKASAEAIHDVRFSRYTVSEEWLDFSWLARMRKWVKKIEESRDRLSSGREQ